MENNKFVIIGKEPCPQVELDFTANRFSFSETCYPENCAEFFDPISSRIQEHLAALSDADVLFELKLTYFNSGASRVFSRFFDLLEECASAGNRVRINWCCEADDENMIELANDFKEDFQAADFKVVVIEAF